MKVIKAIDLFCEAGGLTLGFKEVFKDNLEFVWTNDFNKPAAATYTLNNGTYCETGDINEILSDPEFKVPQADMVIGGPPCQGFSLLNKNFVS